MLGNIIGELCISYNVFIYNEKTRIKYEIIKCLNEIVNSYGENQVYIFAPVSYSSNYFYQILSIQNRQKLKRIPKNELSVTGLIAPIFIRKRIGAIKCIIDTVVTPPIYQLIKKIILQIVNRCKVVNIYQYLEEKGYEFESDWYIGLGLMYDEIYADYELYKKSCGTEDEKVSIKRLIGDYLEIKDFINAEKWIRHLSVRYGYNDAEVLKYQELWKKIQSYLEEIKRNIEEKEHIVVNWVDNLRYDELSNMEYLSEQVHSGIHFEKMYVPAPFTHAVLKALTAGKYIIDDKAFMMTECDCKDGKLLRHIESHNYRFMCSSPMFFGGPFHNNCSIMALMYQNRAWVPSTVIQFDAICNLAEAEDKCFYIIHNMCETHKPFLNPVNPAQRVLRLFTTLQEIQSLKLQIVESQKYLDEQLQYYGRFYQNIKCNIYMSDHGKSLGETPICIEGAHHVIFSICQRGGQSQNVQTLYSLIDFPELIEKVLEDDLSEINRIHDKDYVLIERDDVYSQEFRETVEDEKITNGLQYMQYRGVVTKDDIFVRLTIGKEFYFRDNKNENLIDDEQYRERIDYLRTLAGNKYINIYKEKRYKEAIILYEHKGWRVDENIEFIE